MLDLREDKQHENKFEEYSVEDCIAYLDGLTDVIEGGLMEFATAIQQLVTHIEDTSTSDWELIEDWTGYLNRLASRNVFEASMYLIEDDADDEEVA